MLECAFSRFQFQANKLGNIKEFSLEQRPLLNRSSKLKREGPMSKFKANIRKFRALFHNDVYFSINSSVTCHDIDRQTEGQSENSTSRYLLALILFKYMGYW
jgi:hypothetical protein